MMHIAMHVKSTKRLPTHDVIYSIVHLKESHIGGSFGPSVIVRLFHRRFFMGQRWLTVGGFHWIRRIQRGKESKVNVY